MPDQDRRRWDRLLIRRGLASLARAEALPEPPGPYTVQATIAACHARATRVQDTDWTRIAALYAVLGALWPSPVVELNRAVAVGMSTGAAAGFDIVEQLVRRDQLANYPQLHAVRGDLLGKLGRRPEARDEFARAAELTRNTQERELYLLRAAELD